VNVFAVEGRDEIASELKKDLMRDFVADMLQLFNTAEPTLPLFRLACNQGVNSCSAFLEVGNGFVEQGEEFPILGDEILEESKG
jgi:hypothetical protein